MPRRGRTIVRRQRRRKIWAAAQETFASSTDGAVDLLTDYRTDRGVLQADPGMTIMRVVGRIQVQKATGTLTSQDGVLYGLVVDSSTRAVANVSRPGTSEHDDWMMWQWLPVAYGENVSPTDTDLITSYDVDVKARRRLEEVNDTLWFSWAITGLNNAAVSITVRVLLLLP